MNRGLMLNAGLVLGIIGALLAVSSVVFAWVDVSATLADSTRQTVSVSGLDLIMDDGPSEVIEGAYIPLVMLCLGVLAIIVCLFTRFSGRTVDGFLIMIALTAVAFISSSLIGDAGLVNNTGAPSLPGMMEVTPWLEGLFSEDIYTATLAGGVGKYVGIAGMIVSTFGASWIYFARSEKVHTG